MGKVIETLIESPTMRPTPKADNSSSENENESIDDQHDTVERALEWLEEISKQYEHNKSKHIANTFVPSIMNETLLKGLSQSRDHRSQVEEIATILLKNIFADPYSTTVSINALNYCISCFRGSSLMVFCMKCDEILNSLCEKEGHWKLVFSEKVMKKLHRPNAGTFNAILEWYAISNKNVNNAIETLYQKMIKLNVQPNLDTFRRIVAALSSCDDDKIEKWRNRVDEILGKHYFDVNLLNEALPNMYEKLLPKDRAFCDSVSECYSYKKEIRLRKEFLFPKEYFASFYYSEPWRFGQYSKNVKTPADDANIRLAIKVEILVTMFKIHEKSQVNGLKDLPIDAINAIILFWVHGGEAGIRRAESRALKAIECPYMDANLNLFRPILTSWALTGEEYGVFHETSL